MPRSRGRGWAPSPDAVAGGGEALILEAAGGGEQPRHPLEAGPRVPWGLHRCGTEPEPGPGRRLPRPSVGERGALAPFPFRGRRGGGRRPPAGLQGKRPPPSPPAR